MNKLILGYVVMALTAGAGAISTLTYSWAPTTVTIINTVLTVLVGGTTVGVHYVSKANSTPAPPAPFYESDVKS